MKLSGYILIFLSAILTRLDSTAQVREQVDTTVLYEVLNSHIQKIEKREFQELYFLRLNSKSCNENDSSKENNFFIELCPAFFHWNKNRIISRLASFKPSDAIQKLDNSCFISCPVFNESKTRCRIYSRIHHGEWSSYSAYFYYKRVRGKWKFLKSDLVSIS